MALVPFRARSPSSHPAMQRGPAVPAAAPTRCASARGFVTEGAGTVALSAACPAGHRSNPCPSASGSTWKPGIVRPAAQAWLARRARDARHFAPGDGATAPPRRCSTWTPVRGARRPNPAGIRQRNRRPPDLFRHTRSHARPESMSLECGVQADARRWGGKAAEAFEMDVADRHRRSQPGPFRVSAGGTRSIQTAGPWTFAIECPGLIWPRVRGWRRRIATCHRAAGRRPGSWWRARSSPSP